MSCSLKMPLMCRLRFRSSFFLPQEEIPEKQLQVFCRCAEAADVVVVIGPDQRVAEIPCVPGENVVGDIEAQRPQVLDEENSDRAGNGHLASQKIQRMSQVF